MKPYLDPEPRIFAEWCKGLGLESDGRQWPADQIMTYEEFCFLPYTRLRKVREGKLYGFWYQHGDVLGEPRTVQEWLNDIGWHIVEPSDEDLKDLNLFLGHDEFWEWGSGRIEPNAAINKIDFKGLFDNLKRLFTNK